MSQPENNTPVIVGLDIGTTKVVVVVGTKEPNGKINIIGLGRSVSQGVIRANVFNIEDAAQAIREALADCLKDTEGLSIKEVYVGIAGYHIKSIQGSGSLIREFPDQPITQKEVNKLIEDQRRTNIPAGYKIIHIIPKYYSIDGHPVQKAVGCNGHKLEGIFHIITADIGACRNIHNAIKKAGLDIVDFELQPLASATALVSPEDLETGVLVMDIGGGTTDVVVFHKNILHNTAIFPIGGQLVTEDLKDHFGLLEVVAEPLKKEYGSALAEKYSMSEYVSIPPYRGSLGKEIKLHTMAEIIQERMSKNLDYVIHFLQQSGVSLDSIHNVILTGGGSKLKYLPELIELKLGLIPRHKSPTHHFVGKYAKELKEPEYATVIGLLIRGFSDYEYKKAVAAYKKTVSRPSEASLNTELSVTPPSSAHDAAIAKDNLINAKEKKEKNSIFGGFLDKVTHWGSNVLTEMFGEEDDEKFHDEKHNEKLR